LAATPEKILKLLKQLK